MSTNDFNNNNSQDNINSTIQPEHAQPEQAQSEQVQSEKLIDNLQPTQCNVTSQCPRCKNNISKQKYCNFCGLNLESYQQAIPQQPQQYYQVQQPYNPYYNSQQQNFNNPQYTYNGQQKKSSKIGFIITGSILLFITLVVICIVSVNFIFHNVLNTNEFGTNKSYVTPNEPQVNPSGISESEFRKIKIGMSYARISAIIGGDGVNSADGQTPQGDKYYTFTWFGETNSNARVHITFTNDKASDIVDDGLMY